MLTPRKKKLAMKGYQEHDKDTGSASVQIALLSRRISELTMHLKKNAKDHHSRRGLLQMVGKRRRLLNYLGRTDKKGYEKLVKELELKK
jgi:small subunit ribosomal protein S15